MAYLDQFNIANVVNYLNKEFTNQVFGGNPLYAKLNSNGRKKPVDGGYKFWVPVMSGRNTTAGWLPSSYDEIDLTPQGGVNKAEYTPKIFTTSVVMSELEQAQNRGVSEVIDLWEFKIEQAKMTAQERFNQDLYKDGTDDVNAITGLKAIVSDSGTYAGITRSTDTWWKAYVNTNPSSFDEDDWLVAFNTVSRNGLSYPDLIVTTQTLWEAYHASLVDNVRYEDKEMANLGFKSLTFMGIPVVWDNDCQSGQVYFLNTKHLALRPYKGYDLQWTEKRQPARQLVDAIICRWYGQLTTSSCRHQGRIDV